MQYIAHGSDLPHDKMVPVLHINKIFYEIFTLVFLLFSDNNSNVAKPVGTT